MQIDLPPHLQERVVCSIAAAVKYGIPANILLAVAEKEGGKAGQWVRNNNGTYDVGPLQFNTAYLRQLSRYGITPVDVASSGCYPYQLAAWRLRQHIKHDASDLWTRCANYHSRSPAFNARYREDLIRKSAKWADWLRLRYPPQGSSEVAWVAPKAPLCNSSSCSQFDSHQARSGKLMKPSYVPRTLIRPPKP